MRRMYKIFYNLMSASFIVQEKLFGRGFEAWSYRVLNIFTSLVSILLLWIAFEILKLDVFISLIVALSPFILIFLFYRQDDDVKLNIQLEKFKQQHTILQIAFIFPILVMFIVLPLMLIAYLFII